METNLYLAFLGFSIAIIVIPGPSILLIISNSLQSGTVTGLFTVAGTSAAMLIQLTTALIILNSIFVFRPQDLNVIRWAGFAYLCYLGIKRWRGAFPNDDTDHSNSQQHRSAFNEGFIVSLTNPTTMAFFVAFFPQFLNPDGSLWTQLLFMSGSFWLLALPFDIAYALFAGRLGVAFQSPGAIALRNRCSGIVILGAAIWMAFARV